MKSSYSLIALTLCLLPIQAESKPAVALVVEDDSVLNEYDFIGEYDVTSLVKVTSGQTRKSAVTSLRYRVYSNGAEIRLYQDSVSGAYHSYTIYRSDGIAEPNAHGDMTVKPGIQARQVKADLVKQLSLTQQHLTITEFPPLSNSVTVSFAKRASAQK